MNIAIFFISIFLIYAIVIINTTIKTTVISDLQNMFNRNRSLLSIEKSLNSLEDREKLKSCIDSISELIMKNKNISK